MSSIWTNVRNRFRSVGWLALWGGLGGVLCVLADFVLKGQRSLVRNFIEISQTYNGNYSYYLGLFIMLVVLPLLSVLLCVAAGPKNKAFATYLGATILTVMFNFVPPTEFPAAKLYPASAEIRVDIRDVPVQQALVTVREGGSNRLLARNAFQSNRFSFYLDDGDYVIEIEIPGYKTVRREITVRGDAPVVLDDIVPEPSRAPSNLMLF